MLPPLPTPYETLAQIERLLRDTSAGSKEHRMGEAIGLARSALAIREAFKTNLPETHLLLVDYAPFGSLKPDLTFMETEAGQTFADAVQILRYGDIPSRVVGVYRAGVTLDDVSKSVAGALAAAYGDDMSSVAREFCEDHGVELREVA
jgi:hypothetical protein